MTDTDHSEPIPFDPDLEEKLRRDSPAVDAINKKFARGSERMRRFEAGLDHNTKVTEQTAKVLAENTEMTREMWEVWSTAKSGLEALAKLGRGLAKVGRWIVAAAKVLAPVAAAVVGIYHAIAALKGGTVLPPK